MSAQPNGSKGEESFPCGSVVQTSPFVGEISPAPFLPYSKLHPLWVVRLPRTRSDFGVSAATEPVEVQSNAEPVEACSCAPHLFTQGFSISPGHSLKVSITNGELCT